MPKTNNLKAKCKNKSKIFVSEIRKFNQSKATFICYTNALISFIKIKQLLHFQNIPKSNCKHSLIATYTMNWQWLLYKSITDNDFLNHLILNVSPWSNKWHMQMGSTQFPRWLSTNNIVFTLLHHNYITLQKSINNHVFFKANDASEKLCFLSVKIIMHETFNYGSWITWFICL